MSGWGGGLRGRNRRAAADADARAERVSACDCGDQRLSPRPVSRRAARLQRVAAPAAWCATTLALLALGTRFPLFAGLLAAALLALRRVLKQTFNEVATLCADEARRFEHFPTTEF